LAKFTEEKKQEETKEGGVRKEESEKMT